MVKQCENCIIRKCNSLNALNIHSLRNISKSKQRISIKKGEVIFDEGQKLNGVFCVSKGAANLSKNCENGKKQIIKIITQGEVIGTRSLLSDEFTNLSAVAINKMELCYIPKKNIIDSVNSDTAFSKAIMSELSSNLKIANNTIVDLAQKSVVQRIAKLILYLHHEFGTDKEGFISLCMSRIDFAGIVGSATETCIRIMAMLNKNGFVSYSGKKIKIDDIKGLQQLENNSSFFQPNSKENKKQHSL